MRVFKNLGFPIGEPEQQQESDKTFVILVNNYEMRCLIDALRKDGDNDSSTTLCEMLTDAFEQDHEKEIIANISQLLRQLKKRQKEKSVENFVE